MYGGLDNFNQFILYKKVWIEAKQKWNKIPCSLDGESIDAHDVDHHASFNDVLLAAQLLGDEYGHAFVLTENDPLWCLDIDHCAIQGAWSDLATQLCAMFPGAYVEISMSGTGLHIMGSGSAPDHKCKNIPLGIELYTESRFIALGTAGQGSVLTDHTTQLQNLVNTYFNATNTSHGGAPLEWTDKPEPGSRPIMNDDALLAKAMQSTSAGSAFGGKASFADLFNANHAVLCDCYGDNAGGYDASSVDAALASHLMFWTGGDCDRVSRLMRRSALVRDKWDRRGDDYIKRTILGAKGQRATNDYYRMTDDVVTVVEPASDAAVELTEKVQSALSLMVNSQLNNIEGHQPLTITCYPEIVDQIITRSFWSGTKSKLYLLSDEGALNMYREQDMMRLAQKHFGNIWEQAELDIAIAALREAMVIETLTAEKEFIKRLNNVGITIICDYLKMYNQRDRLEVRVDMFATRPRVEWHPEKVTVVHTWSPLPVINDNIRDDIINDYKQHFPEVDRMLEFIIASRFASNRKHFYTWLQCPSDWGKGFFTGILNKLGVLVELSVTECEKAFEGSPLGRDASEFTRAFVILFDEFKSIKSELKQLENEIPITPKNQLKQSVEVFTKLFTSAEGVESLAGENGVEDQFANRFSYIDGNGQINKRELFNSVGGATYARTITAWVARRINELVDQYVALGHEEACNIADNHGRDFHNLYNIGQKFERISENIPTMVSDFRDWLVEKHQPRMGVSTCLHYEDGFYYLKSASKMVGEWIEETASRSEMFTLKKKKTEILKALSDDGQGVKNQRVAGKQIKSIRFAL